jgi:anhydro-N-acetylmuramic acid kinase
MSGTALDGVSAALVRFEEPSDGDVRVSLLAHYTLAYGGEQRSRIAHAVTDGDPRELALLHAELGEWHADAARAVLETSGVAPADVAFVASHGQTVWHEPRRSSLQLGNPAVIAERAGIAVVSDFRSRDVAAGGEGAPLVPRADRVLFARDDGSRALLNLGGIANLTLAPRRGDDAPLLAFDTGPGVMVIDACVRRLFPGARFDQGGRIAAGGRVVEEVVAESLSHPFFAAPPPKSTGRETFGDAYTDAFVSRCLERGASPADAVASATELTGRAIGLAALLLPADRRPLDVVRSGGGAKNLTLVRAIERCWTGVEHRSFDDLFFPGEAKEAVAFAFLGYLTWTGRPGNEPGATGAAGPRILGSITPR